MHKHTLGCLLVGIALLGCGDDASDGSGGSGASSSSSGGAGGGAGGSGGGSCSSPLPEETLQSLALGLVDHWQVQPGGSIDFRLGVPECCYVLQEVDACAVYSVSPSEVASIDAATGLLSVGLDAVDGTVLTVTADVESGRRLVTAEVHVYTPEESPLVGTWSETAQIPCGGGVDIEPEQVIHEIVFFADGHFWVTWMPFELYVDYWGSYEFDLATGALTMSVEGGNYVPSDVDGVGSFSIDAGVLSLEEMWLGTPQTGTATAQCGHRLE